jgi:ribosomal protein RSM22 (predicted rRNA methylase)
LRAAVDRALSGRRTADLAAAAAVLSERYRDERRDGRLHVQSDDDALADALLVEASPAFRACGEALAHAATLPRTTWRTADAAAAAFDGAPRDLVTLAYVLNELAPEVRPALLRRLWQATTDTLVIVEPGTPAGWQASSPRARR